MNVTKISNTVYQIETSSKSGPILSWLINLAITNPELILKIIQALVSLVKWAFENLIGKNGKPKTPFWMKALSWFGNKEINKLRTVCDEACDAIEQMPEIRTVTN